MIKYDCFSSEDIEGSENQRRIAIESISDSLEELKRLSERENKLCEIERRFLETGDAAHLKEFRPTHEFKKITLAEEKVEEKIDGPTAIWIPKDRPEEQIQKRHQDVMRMFPHIEIREVTTAEGKAAFAYIGADARTIASALSLLRSERETQAAIDLQSAQLRTFVEAFQEPSSDCHSSAPLYSVPTDRKRSTEPGQSL